jgi:hypothetical protein
MTEEGKSPKKPKAGIFLLPWKTQRTRFPHSHCPTAAANLFSEAKVKQNLKGAFLHHHSCTFRLILQLEKTPRILTTEDTEGHKGKSKQKRHITTGAETRRKQSQSQNLTQRQQRKKRGCRGLG